MSPGLLTLFNHLGRLIENIRRNRDAELLGRLEVDDQVELRRLLYGKICRFRTLEDLGYVGGYSAVQMQTIPAVGHEPSFFHKLNPMVNRR